MRATPLMLLVLNALALTACMNDATAPPTQPGLDGAVVFENGPHVRQCEPPVITLAQSAGKLAAAGVPVQRSSCGYIEGVAYPTVCGAGTGQILLHDIPSSGLPAAQAAGFTSVTELQEWRRDDCPQYLHAIEEAQGTLQCADQRNRVFVIQNALQPHCRTWGWAAIFT